MGVWLDYFTTDPISPEVEEAINSAAEKVVQAHDWWTEPLRFLDAVEDDGRLYGRTKIFLGSYSTQGGGLMNVDFDDDSLMAYRDTCFILGKLAEWSQKFSFDWQIDCASEPVGTITKGQWDGQRREFVDGMKNSFPWPFSFEEKARSISEKYASRW